MCNLITHILVLAVILKKMEKYRFNIHEKFSVWKAFDCKCFWCSEPMSFKHVTIDHLFPENLLESPTALEQIKVKYNLPDFFEINDFSNWVPAHSYCNSSKGARIIRESNGFHMLIEKVLKTSSNSCRIYGKMLRIKKKDKVIGDILTNLRNNTITNHDLLSLFERTKIGEYNYLNIINNLKIMIPPGWEFAGFDDFKNMYVTKGTRSGIVPVRERIEEIDHTWKCTCGNYGPWQGTRCLSCGQQNNGWD